MTTEKNYYEVIGLTRDASGADIRRAYRELVRKYHPDSNPNSPEATEKFIQIQQAYEVLGDPQQRAKYDRTLPADHEPLSIKTIYSRKNLVKVSETQLLFVLLEISPPEDKPEDDLPPLNICMVLDRSTSMKGERMDMVKSTAIEIMRHMRSEDIFSIVAFGDRANVIVPAGQKINQAQVELDIQMLQTGGGTEIYQGLLSGYEQIIRNASARYINHILLITDGRTYGDEEQCISLAREAAARGIGISGLGIGSQWNDAFLDELASLTGGDTTFIERSADIRLFLEEKFNRLAKIFADHVKFQYQNQTGVTFNYAFRLQPEAGPLAIDGDEIIFGSIPGNEPLKVLFEIALDNIPEADDRVTMTEGQISANIPGSNQGVYSRRITYERQVVMDSQRQPTSIEIVKALSQITLYRMQEKAQNEVKEGKIDQAAERLQNLATHLLAQGQEELARTVLTEAKHISQTRSISSEGGKRIKYGTRSLMLPSEAGGKA
jgi:Ca-activated chloride channel homolog